MCDVVFLFRRILAKGKHLKNIAKVIEARKFSGNRLKSRATGRVISFELIVKN
jgi:hypothetical protein